MNLAFLRRPRDTPAPAHTAEEPDTANIIRLLSRSPLITELVFEEADAELVAREDLLSEVERTRDEANSVVSRLFSESAAARVDALAKHKVWAEAERKHAALSAELFYASQEADAAIQRLERELANTAPPFVSAFQAELEAAIEQAMAARAPLPEGVGIPQPIDAGLQPGPVPAGARASGPDMPAPRPSVSRAPTRPAKEPSDWYSVHCRRLQRLRDMRADARAAALEADPTATIAHLQDETRRLLTEIAS